MVPIRDRDPLNADLQRFTSVTLEKIGDAQVAQGNLAGALKSYKADLAVAGRLPCARKMSPSLSFETERSRCQPALPGSDCARREIMSRLAS
jgi:hypothetical protein